MASRTAKRIAFESWMRTGAMPDADAIERKFNPYHDERGRFTFGPGGPAAALRLAARNPTHLGTTSKDRAMKVYPGLNNYAVASFHTHPGNYTGAYRASNDDQTFDNITGLIAIVRTRKGFVVGR